tara:strand:- start:8 stop:631 length:624 start_codon:yes stop_codon:yes gene_type:complete
MAITYPRPLPTVTGLQTVTLRAVNQTALTFSPFSFKQQIHNHSGQRWEAEIQLPAMKREKAEVWVAWLLSLRGMSGSFLLYDPSNTVAQGALGGTPLIKGASQTGGSLSIDGCSNSITNWLKAGDYIQLGSGSNATLHKNLVDVSTNGSGQATLDLWPSIRTARPDNEAITTTSCVGRFRLNSGEQDWSINSALHYGITFAAVEVIP